MLSDPPIFDFGKAKIAKSFVRKEHGEALSGFKSLELALTLALYNFLAKGGEEKDLGDASLRLKRLAEEEIAASYISNPLPSVGIEVESPRRPFMFSSYLYEKYKYYKEFFDFMGMPRNKVNEDGRISDYWEFSLRPSYSASTQARILSELLKGRFIPSLNRPYDPELVERNLDHKLVSLHVNLGMFENPDANMGRGITPDFRIFALGLAFAFDSPERLLSRLSDNFFTTKSSNIVSLKRSKARLEVKALEVSDSSTYRLLHEAQVIASALFASLSKDPKIAKSGLAEKWRETALQICEIFDCLNVNINYLPQKKDAYNLAKETRVSADLRRVLDRKTHEIEAVLKSKKALH